MCSHYWPAAGEKKQCGKYLTVELTEERAYEDYVHRDFKITFTDEVVSSAYGAGNCRFIFKHSKLFTQMSLLLFV